MKFVLYVVACAVATPVMAQDYMFYNGSGRYVGQANRFGDSVMLYDERGNYVGQSVTGVQPDLYNQTERPSGYGSSEE